MISEALGFGSLGSSLVFSSDSLFELKRLVFQSVFWLWHLVVLLVDTRQVRWDPCRPIIISSSYALRTWRWRWLIPPKCQYTLSYHTLPQRRRPKISAIAVECWTLLRAFLHSESRFLSISAQHWFSDKHLPCLSCLRFIFRLLARGLYFGSGKIFYSNRRAVDSTYATIFFHMA